MKNKHHKLESIEKIRKSNMNKIMSIKARLLISIAQLGKKHGPPSEKTRLLIGKGNKNKIVSQETRDKIGKKSLGRKHTPESIELMRQLGLAKRKDIPAFRRYRKQCRFFIIFEKYPDEFDTNKAKSIYQPIRNPMGYTRDHRYSIWDGFVNKIDPKIISHPANCELLSHRDNARKNTKSSITIEELLTKIKIWDDKYIPWKK